MNDNARAWVAALRSGKYEQGPGFLKQDDKYCCLGVACDIYIRSNEGLSEAWEPEVCSRTWKCCGKRSTLPEAAAKWIGLRDDCGCFRNGPAKSLVELNDSKKWSFDQIADFIESEPEGLFE